MDNVNEYFAALQSQFDKEYAIAKEARTKGYDTEMHVEITPAPDIAGRVEGLIGVRGLGELIRNKIAGRSRSELAFEMAKEICTNRAFENGDTAKRILLAVRVGLAILTEGVLVAPTEGVQGIGHYRNADNSDYVSVIYAGPIRGAGGTAAALSVALADYARQFFNISAYKATQDEIERYIEEIEIYNSDILRLQYMPSEDDMRHILESCPVCIDGLPTEQVEVSVHTDLSRIGINGKKEKLENRIRSGVALVLSNMVLKAKSVLRETKKAGLDWGWLNKVIRVEKPSGTSQGQQQDSNEEAFLEELVAGRPILAYPNHIGGFRLRYGRSRLTGIAAKGFSPATMLILDSFIGIGTQLKVELPGKGCIAMPVDTIEGPFVRLKSGEALRINTAEKAKQLKDDVEAIISVGDILISFGDFRKSNTQLAPSSYVEELWRAELQSKGFEPNTTDIGFDEAYALSLKYCVPLHPKYLFEFQAVTTQELRELAASISTYASTKDSLDAVAEMRIAKNEKVKEILERLNVPHRITSGEIAIEKDYAKSLLVSLGFFSGSNSNSNSKAGSAIEKIDKAMESAGSALELANAVSGVKLAKRSTFIGARLGRPEKARERMMQPAPNALFPISAYGGRDRNISNAYAKEASKFNRQTIKVEIARYKCSICDRLIGTPYCYDCGKPARIETGEDGKAYGDIEIDIDKTMGGVVKRLGLKKVPDVVKGVKGLINKEKIAEPVEKGVLRALHNIYVYKDGTTRFDATDAPITHFYPSEIGTSVETLKRLGYSTDYENKPLESEDQLVELKHQDIIMNRRGAEYLLRVSQFIDDLLEKYYGMERFYNAETAEDMIGAYVITLSPHTSCAVLNRIIGITDANVGLAHPYTISARRRNTDGDEDTTMLLLDALLNFSRKYLPATVGGTMDAPLLLTTKVVPEEVDDEVHSMEAVTQYALEFYEKTFARSSPGEVRLDTVETRLGTERAYRNLGFTHMSTSKAIADAPKRSRYVLLKTMQEKISEEFRLLDMLYSIDRRDAAKRLIMSHFIPDLMGNLHSFSKQKFRCATCNAKYRRVPLIGKCPKDGGKLLLTISKGGIEKYLNIAIELANRYDIETYIKQRLQLLKEEIIGVFGSVTEPDMQQSSLQANAGKEAAKGQFDLSRFA
ncbi:MAG: DNA polymerase II large subunit [Candidatus Micrarchaeaceae archaeon]